MAHVEETEAERAPDYCSTCGAPQSVRTYGYCLVCGHRYALPPILLGRGEWASNRPKWWRPGMTSPTSSPADALPPVAAETWAPRVPGFIQAHGVALVVGLVAVGLGVLASAARAPSPLAPGVTLLAADLFSAAGLVAFLVMPPDRATRYGAPGRYRIWLAYWGVEGLYAGFLLVLGAAANAAPQNATSEASDLVKVLAAVLVVGYMLAISFLVVLGNELARWTRVRLRQRLLRRSV